MNAVVRDVMTPDVITVSEDTSFEVIAAALRENRVSAFPVLDEASQVIGVVSESDLLAKLALGIDDHGTVPGMITGIVRGQQLKKAHAVTAAELMTSPAYTAAPEDTVEQAARIMYLRNVKRLPVVDVGGRLAGIVSRADVLAVYGRTDADIAEEIRTGILSTETPADPGTLDVSVTAGVATIVGRPQTREQGHAIIGRARHVQGVVAVRDRLELAYRRGPARGLPSVRARRGHASGAVTRLDSPRILSVPDAVEEGVDGRPDSRRGPHCRGRILVGLGDRVSPDPSRVLELAFGRTRRPVCQPTARLRQQPRRAGRVRQTARGGP
jgi:CBS-domain-containing membrane protein